MLSISIGTIGALSRVSRTASLISRHTGISGWTRQSALGARDTRTILDKSVLDTPRVTATAYKPGEPIPDINFAQEKLDISKIDTSGIVDMRAFFSDLSDDISHWDISGVQSMYSATPELPPTPFDVDTSKWELSMLKDAQIPKAVPPSPDFPSSPAP